MQDQEGASMTGAKSATTQTRKSTASPQISNMTWKQRATTTNLFRKGRVSANPKVPKSQPEVDIIQGIPTLIKTQIAKVDAQCFGRIHLGSALEFMTQSMSEPMRLLIGIYDIEHHKDSDGNKYEVQNYHRVIEVILTPEDAKILHGQVTIEKLENIKSKIASYPESRPVGQKKKDLHKLTASIRDDSSVAKNLLKIERSGNVQLKSCIVLGSLRTALVFGGKDGVPLVYEGNEKQLKYIEHDTEFYGLSLPWRTTVSESSPLKRTKRLRELSIENLDLQEKGQDT